MSGHLDMISRRFGLCVAICAGLLISSFVVRGAEAQLAPGRITGRLLDREHRHPVEGARVTVLGTPISAITDSAGRFVLMDVPAGVRVVQIRAIGYAVGSWMVELSEAQHMSHEFEIEARPVQVSGVTAVGVNTDWRSEAGFERRRAHGAGVFLTREEIASRRAIDITDLLRSITGIVSACTPRGCVIRMARSTRQCTPEFFLDGFPATFATGPNFPVNQIRGVEVYRSEFEVPGEFQRPGLRCGVIAIWTIEPGERFRD